jgi:DNA-binding beta-propeller fold protein YncE
MQRKAFLPFGLIVALTAASARPAQAKDRFYHLGQGVIEVIDGDTDTIAARIPVKGWAREAALTSDKKFLHVTTQRHLIHKVSLADNKVVATVDVNGGGWERFIFGFVMGPDDGTAYAAIMSRRTEGGEVVIGKPVVAQLSLDTGQILRSVEVPLGVARLVRVNGAQRIYALGKDLYKIDASGSGLAVTETMPMFEKKWNILPLWDYAWENGGLATMNYYTPELMGLLTVDEKTGEITDIPLKGDPVFAYSVIFTADRKKGYAVMDDLSEIDVVNAKYGRIIPIQEGTSYGVNLSSNGKKIYVGAGGSSVTVYDAKTLKPLKVLKMASDAMDLRRIVF